jgi:hypothetical protein
VGEPADGAGGGEDELAGLLDHLMALGHRRHREVDVRERQPALCHRADHLDLGVRQGPDLVEELEEQGGAWVAVPVHAVAEPSDELALAEPPADRLRRGDASVDLPDDLAGGTAGRTVQRTAERREPGLDHEVRIGPGRRGHAGRQGRRGQLVVGEQHERRLEQSHAVRLGRVGGQP